MRERALPTRPLALTLLLAWIGVLAQLPGPALPIGELSSPPSRPDRGDPVTLGLPYRPDVTAALVDHVPGWSVVAESTDGNGGRGSRPGRRGAGPRPLLLVAPASHAVAPPSPEVVRPAGGAAVLGLLSLPANAPPLA